MSLSPGESFGPFTVERMLGEGGMASVYLVRDDQARPFALKVLHRGTSEAARARLLAEGRVQRALDHPNVVAVSQILEEQRQLGLIMEYVDGPSLAELLAAGPLEADSADALAVGILAGIEAAHEAGGPSGHAAG